ASTSAGDGLPCKCHFTLSSTSGLGQNRSLFNVRPSPEAKYSLRRTLGSAKLPSFGTSFSTILCSSLSLGLAAACLINHERTSGFRLPDFVAKRLNTLGRFVVDKRLSWLDFKTSRPASPVAAKASAISSINPFSVSTTARCRVAKSWL